MLINIFTSVRSCFNHPKTKQFSHCCDVKKTVDFLQHVLQLMWWNVTTWKSGSALAENDLMQSSGTLVSKITVLVVVYEQTLCHVFSDMILSQQRFKLHVEKNCGLSVKFKRNTVLMINHWKPAYANLHSWDKQSSGILQRLSRHNAWELGSMCVFVQGCLNVRQPGRPGLQAAGGAALVISKDSETTLRPLLHKHTHSHKILSAASKQSNKMFCILFSSGPEAAHRPCRR